MKINKISSIVIGLEFVYALCKIILIPFDSARLMNYASIFLIVLLLLISAIGIFFNKKWAVIMLWIYILLPSLLRITMSFAIFIGGYSFLVINTIIATYFSMTLWKKEK